MNVPVFVLLGFAMWTLLTLFGGIGVYRWSRICRLQRLMSAFRGTERTL